jgi:hypothetical protein
MIIKRRLEKVSSIFLTPTAGRAIQFDHIAKDQGPATIVKLGREGPSFFDIVRECLSLNAPCSLLIWRACATTSTKIRT